ncbi:cilia- and flagella-associated protein 251 [Rhodamnia argentea]|uniref:Cilia- and flagella-associated protein 251 n=1 Tax=Rhodamnia argentea TaxID=178133 RepID=A0A8B8QTM7_9MYRT|nr:cilia- and flagella-associated protein 251 [Rhodamnia argentea]XP_030550374.1 cilia- and flagella-associated protein 251 [Rhodamnia argentea]XP_048134820.1 cilia- and flagella-associated protein 251 [Rhodamnia argentea]
MIKKSSSRNQRSKGVKIKHGLQILLLLGICFWLIYQVKYSHDKKRELNEKDSKTSVKDDHGDAVIFGRKDLRPRRDETLTNHVEDEDESRDENDESKRDEEHDEETSKHEEEQGEEVNKREHDEREDANESVTDQEAAGGHEEEEEHEEEENRIDDLEVLREAGEDEIDEPDEEKLQGELDHEEEFIDDEKEREEDNDEKETEGDDGDDKEGQAEDENVSEDEEHDESESSHSRHEAREQNYKADDASSAVTHDVQTALIDTDKLGSHDADDNSGSSKTGQESNSTISSQINDGQDILRSNMEGNQVAEKAANSSEVVSEIEDHDDAKASLANSSLLKPAVTTKAKDQENAVVNSSEVNMGSSNNLTMTGPSINGTENILDSPQAQNRTVVGAHASDGSDQQNIRVEMAKASTRNSSGGESDSTSSISTTGVANSSNVTSGQTSAVSGENINSDTKGEAENVLKLPSMKKENDVHTHKETLDRRSEAGSSNTS